MDEQTARKILLLKQNYFYRRHDKDVGLRGQPSNTDEYHKKLIKSIVSHGYITEKWIVYFSFDIGVSPQFYSTIEHAEEMQSGDTTETISLIINYQIPIEAYDNTLPPNQNLWNVFAQTHLNPVYAFRTCNINGYYDRGAFYPIEDIIKKDISTILSNPSSFLWYYDIIVNRRFVRKVYINILSIRAVGVLFCIFGGYFIDTFLQREATRLDDSYMMIISDSTLPKIELADPEVFRYFSYSYVSLVQFLNEEKIRRRL